jgi:hypothetical protein
MMVGIDQGLQLGGSLSSGKGECRCGCSESQGPLQLSAYCDEDINTSATIIPSIEIVGPITRSRAQQLNHQVNSFLCSSTYNIESRLLSNDLIVLRNQGEDHGGQTEHQEGAGEPRRRAREGGEPIQFRIDEFESNSESRTTSYSN